MLKKILIALVAVTLLTVPFYGVALAEEERPEGIRVRGEVIAHYVLRRRAVHRYGDLISKLAVVASGVPAG